MKYTLSFSSSSPSSRHEYVRGLSESQLITTILKRGMHRVASITHDGEENGASQPLSEKETISIWKKVYQRIKP